MRKTLTVFLLFASTAAFAQQIAVRGVPTPKTFTRAELRALPGRVTRVVDDKSYSGVRVADLLVRCGLELDKMKGRDVARNVLVVGSDQYIGLFAMAELLEKFHDADAVLADSVDGADLGDKGPLRLLTQDKTARGRWVDMVTTIEVTAPMKQPDHPPHAPH